MGRYSNIHQRDPSFTTENFERLTDGVFLVDVNTFEPICCPRIRKVRAYHRAYMHGVGAGVEPACQIEAVRIVLQKPADVDLRQKSDRFNRMYDVKHSRFPLGRQRLRDEGEHGLYGVQAIMSFFARTFSGSIQ